MRGMSGTLPSKLSPRLDHEPSGARLHPDLIPLIHNIRQTVVVDPAKLELVLAAMLAQGHILLDDVPGMGKTLLAKALARSIHAVFKRVQCTPACADEVESLSQPAPEDGSLRGG